MKKITSLIILTQTLSKAEKRYFRLTANLQSGEKMYLSLFDLIENHPSAEDVEAEFCRRYDSKSFDIAVKHLNQTLMDCLIQLRGEQDIQAKIFHSISAAGILFERGLYNEAMTELQKAKKMATMYEMDALELLARRTELKYMNATGFQDSSEKQLVNKQMKIMEVMRYSRSSNLHSQLYDILKYRLLNKGYTRSDKQKDEYNDLILSELHIIANNSYNGFETEKLHTLFQATYYMNAGNHTIAIRNYKMLIALFEENEHMILNPPIYYLQALLGVLNSLLAASLYKEMPYFIEKLKAMEQSDYTTEFRLMVRAHIFLNEFGVAFNTGDFDKAKELIETYQESLILKSNLLALDLQLYILIDLTIMDIADNNLKGARRQMKKIFGSGKVFHTLPVYRDVRLLNLILQAELENYDFIENEVKAIKRQIKYDKETDIMEKLVFNYVLNHDQLRDVKIREKLLKQLQKDTPRINKNKYGGNLLAFFDFPSWIDSKLTRHSFREILAEKNIK